MKNIYFIDLFAGAGGTSTGAHLAGANVVACVNHDANAIKSHALNHPKTKHFTEDVRDFAVVLKLKAIVEEIRKKDSKAVIILWASLECTNFSNAKGGLPRDADSRTLAEHLYMYIDELNPQYLMIENVREFIAWGDLDERGKPVSKDKGRLYKKWVSNITHRNYRYDYRLLNAADFGAYTSRTRYFGVFTQGDYTFSFPTPTHHKEGRKGLEKWKPVKEVLNFEDEGKSIFNRKKPLVENTLKRIYAGLIKFVANGEQNFLIKYNSMNRNGNYTAPGVNVPCPVVTTQNRIGLVSLNFLMKNYSGHPGSKCISTNAPAGTITTIDHHSCVTVKKSAFINMQYGNSFNTSVEQPAATVTVTPKHQLVYCEKKNFLINPQYSSKGSSIEKPCFTLIARMDKQPPYLLTANGGAAIIPNKADSAMTLKIKLLMRLYGISDIKVRMLRIPELLQIQGFPKDYALVGTQTEQKKYIGNAVEVNCAKALIRQFI